MNMQFDLRRKIEAEIDRLIGLLDEHDGDSDIEPSLAGYSFGMDDREGDPLEDGEHQCEDEGAQCDDEGDTSDSGVGDTDGLMEQIGSFNGQHIAGFGSSGFARGVE
jgi:hypothetical protein